MEALGGLEVSFDHAAGLFPSRIAVAMRSWAATISR
jgi:hypothetical protein